MAQTSGLRGQGPTDEPGGVEAERRDTPDRREDGAGGRRQSERFAGLGIVMSAFWAIVGAAVVLFLFFIALDAIDPREARTLSLIVLVLGVLWLGHSWRRLFAGSSPSHADRERRGF